MRESKGSAKIPVRFRDFFEFGDKEAYRMAYDFLIDQRFEMGGPMVPILKMVPNFERAFWRAEYRRIQDYDDQKTIDAYDVIHQALHVLVSRRFGFRLRGKPKLTLLSEAIAGAVQLYYELQFIKNGGKITAARSLRKYSHSAAILNENLIKKFNPLLDDPFEAFKQNAIDSFNLSILLLKNLEWASREKNWSLPRLEKKIKKFKHLVFLREKDFPTFILFTATYSGFKSTRQDEADCKECISLLRASASLSDLMSRLGIFRPDPKRARRQVGL